MTNPRDPEGLMPDADVTGGPAPDAGVSGDQAIDVTGLDEAALAGRTDLDAFGGDPDVRFPGDAEDPAMSTADATATAAHPDPEPLG